MKTVYIFTNPDSEQTKHLFSFIADHIDEINKKVIIKKVNVTKNNVSELKSKGIKQVPALALDGKIHVGVETIKRILKPNSEQRDNFGNSTSAEEMVQKFMAREMAEEDEEDGNNREAYLRQALSSFEKRRADMIGGKNNPVVPKKNTKQSAGFADDESFISASSNYDETPTENYDVDNGDAIWEQYLNDEADQMGRKLPPPGKKVGTRK